MGMLLFLVGLLAGLSGGVKLRRRIRASVGISAVAWIELTVGSLVVLGSGLGLSTTPFAPWVVAATLLLVVVSAVHQGRRAARAQRDRELSEETRLKTFLQGDGRRR